MDGLKAGAESALDVDGSRTVSGGKGDVKDKEPPTVTPPFSDSAVTYDNIASGLTSTSGSDHGHSHAGDRKYDRHHKETEQLLESLTDQTNLLPTRKVVPIYLGLAVCIVVSTLDQTLVATALPSISSHFHAGEQPPLPQED